MVKKAIALLMTLLMLIPLTVACKKGEEAPVDSSEATAVSTESSNEENKYEVYDDLGDIDLGGREIVIANVNRSWYDQEVKVERMTGDIVNDAVFERNANFEDRANAKIKNVRYGERNAMTVAQYAVVNDLRKNVEANLHVYDIINSPVYCTIMYTGEGLFHDLNKVEPLNFEKAYWSQYFNEIMSIGQSQYMATGAVSLSFYRFIFATIVNVNKLNSQSGAPDLMSVVKEGKWTLEYQETLANNYYSDKGVGGKDEADFFGLVTSDYLNVDPYWSSCEISILTKNQDNYYQLEFNTSRMTEVVDRLISFFNGNGAWCCRVDSYHETGNGEQIEIAEKFAAGNALMATLRLNELENEAVRDMTDEYLVLPMPRWSEDQQAYYSFIHDSFTGVAIPSTLPVSDLNDIGIALEAIASESYRTVTPAYYETALKSRYADNPDSWEMLDMITENVKIDAGVMYTKSLDSIHQRFRNIMTGVVRNGKGNTVASTYSTEYLSKVSGLLDTLQNSIIALQSVS